MNLDRDTAELAIERVARTWPLDEARALLELPAVEVDLLLAFALHFDAIPVDPVTLYPIAGDPLRPPRPRRRRPGVPSQDLPGGSTTRPRPAELVTILRRLGSDKVPDELVPGEQAELDLDDPPAAA